ALLAGALDAAEPEIEAEGEETEGEPDEGVAELARIKEELAELRKTRRASSLGLNPKQEAREQELLDLKERFEAGAEHMSDQVVEQWRSEAGLAVSMERAMSAAERAGEPAFAEIAAAVDAMAEAVGGEIVAALAIDWPRFKGTD